MSKKEKISLFYQLDLLKNGSINYDDLMGYYVLKKKNTSFDLLYKVFNKILRIIQILYFKLTALKQSI